MNEGLPGRQPSSKVWTRPPEEILEANVVDRLKYWIDDDGKVHVAGVPGIGEHLVKLLGDLGFDIVLRPTHKIRRSTS